MICVVVCVCVCVCVCVTVQLNDLLQVNKDVFDVVGGEDAVSVQPLVENPVQHLEHPEVGALGVEQLWRRTDKHVWADTNRDLWILHVWFLMYRWWPPAVWSPAAWGCPGRRGWPAPARSEGPPRTPPLLPGRPRSGCRWKWPPHSAPPSYCRAKTQGEGLLRRLMKEQKGEDRGGVYKLFPASCQVALYLLVLKRIIIILIELLPRYLQCDRLFLLQQ